jgi:hypothetical protein
MIRTCIYIAVASVAVFLGVWIIRNQLGEMEEPDQLKAVALFHYLKARSVADKSLDLQDKLDSLTREIKSRWNMTPEELSRYIHRRFRGGPETGVSRSDIPKQQIVSPGTELHAIWLLTWLGLYTILSIRVGQGRKVEFLEKVQILLHQRQGVPRGQGDVIE